MLAGVSLIVSQVLQNLEFMGWPSVLTGLGLAAIVVPCAMAVTVLVMELARDERRYGFALVAFVVLLCGLGHTFVVALERSALARDQRIAATLGHNAPHSLAAKALTDATVRVGALERELSDARRTGCGSICKSLQADVATALAMTVDRQRELARLGAPVETQGMAQRYGALAKGIDTWHPVLLPLAIEMGGLVLVGMAFPRKGRATIFIPAQAGIELPSLASLPSTKIAAAGDKIRQLWPDQDERPTVREVARRIGHSPTTTHRALKLVS